MCMCVGEEVIRKSIMGECQLDLDGKGSDTISLGSAIKKSGCDILIKFKDVKVCFNIFSSTTFCEIILSFLFYIKLYIHNTYYLDIFVETNEWDLVLSKQFGLMKDVI